MPDATDNSGHQPAEHEKHEQRIRDLAYMRTDDPHNFEGLLDNADAAYALAHDAGLLRDGDGTEEPFVYPSVRREQLYNELLRETPRPASIASASVSERGFFAGLDAEQLDYVRNLASPYEGLKGQLYPVAILEEINDNDSMGQGSYSVNWMGCNSLEEATAYCEKVGWNHEKPGPGEDDGVYTTRKIYDNPHYLDQQNAHLGEVDRTAIEFAIAEVMSSVGLDPAVSIIEYALIEGVSHDLEEWNRTVNREMLGGGEYRKVRGYLNHQLREERFRWARGSMKGEIQKTTNEIADAMNGHKPEPFNAEQVEAIESATDAIVSALQTRHELREGTREAVGVALEGFLYIGRMRSLAAEVLNSYGPEEESTVWLEWLDDRLLATARQINTRYSTAMRQYIDGYHFLA